MAGIPVFTQDEVDAFGLEETGVRNLDSPQINLEIDACTLVREYMCKWSALVDVTKFFLGYSQLYTDGGVDKLSRLMPQIDAQYRNFIATKIYDLVGHKWTGNQYTDEETPETYKFAIGEQANVFEKARFKVLFEPRIFDLAIDEDTTDEIDRYVSRESPEPSAELLTMPGAAFRYQRSGGGAPSGVSIPYNVGKIMPQEVFRVCWHRLPGDAWAPGSNLWNRIYKGLSGDGIPLLGCVNQTELFGREPGTVLFSNVRPMRRKSPLGSLLNDVWEWDIIYEFTWRPQPWNWAYYFDKDGTNSGYYHVSSSGSYEAPGSVTDNRSTYNERDLTANLFTVAA